MASVAKCVQSPQNLGETNKSTLDAYGRLQFEK
jgi:hypothetical protein